jgi:hypothetical protein
MKEEILMDYLEGRLSSREQARVEKHLSKCDPCREEILIAGEMLREENTADLETVPEYLTRGILRKIYHQKDNTIPGRIISFIQSLLERGPVAVAALLPWRKPGLSPVRGSKTIIDDSLIALKKSFAELDIEIEIDKVQPGKASIMVVLVTNEQPPQPTRITLLNKGREVYSYLVRGSQAHFENVSFGHYTLVLTVDGVEKGNYSFEIKETRHGKQ